MTRYLTITALALAAAMCQPAQARCITGDAFSTAKALHAVGNAAIVFGADAAIKQWAPETFETHPYLGLVPAIVASAAREVYKSHHPGYRCEYSSMAYDAAGMSVGVAGTRWMLVPQAHGMLVAYSIDFKD